MKLRVNSLKTSLPTNTDGVNGPDKIPQLWREHYHELFNPSVIDRIEKHEDAVISTHEIINIVMKLEDNKACGGISYKHLKFASRRLFPLLAICFTGFFNRFYVVCDFSAYCKRQGRHNKLATITIDL